MLAKINNLILSFICSYSIIYNLLLYIQKLVLWVSGFIFIDRFFIQDKLVLEHHGWWITMMGCRSHVGFRYLCGPTLINENLHLLLLHRKHLNFKVKAFHILVVNIYCILYWMQLHQSQLWNKFGLYLTIIPLIITGYNPRSSHSFTYYITCNEYISNNY